MLPAPTAEPQSCKTPRQLPSTLFYLSPNLAQVAAGKGRGRDAAPVLGPVPCRRARRFWLAPGGQCRAPLPRGAHGPARLRGAATLARHPRQLRPLPAKPGAGGRGAGAEPGSASICPPLPLPGIPPGPCWHPPPGLVLLGPLTGK